MRWIMLVVFLISFIFVSVNLAYAQNPSEISASTNKQSYEPGDGVLITGKVQQLTNENPVTIIVRNPIGNVYEVGQVELMNDFFVHDFVLSDDAQGGIYTVNIKQDNQTAQIQFQVVTGQIQTIPVFGNEIRVIGENANLVKYGNVEVSTANNSITIQTDTTQMQNDSIIEEYQIPKQVIDAPDGLVIKENGNDVNCTQTKTDMERILDCPIQAGTKEFTMIGTIVIPEFGTTTAYVLAFGTLVVVAIFSQTRLLRQFR
ncbi:MAG: hypothetical protein ACREBB_01650 [Nitrosotalea sp.]